MDLQERETKVGKNTVRLRCVRAFIIFDFIRFDYNPHSCLGSRVRCSVPESCSVPEPRQHEP